MEMDWHSIHKAIFIRDSGDPTKHMEKADYITRMVIYMKGTIWMTNQRAGVFTFMQRQKSCMLVSIKMNSLMARGGNNGLMERSMRGAILTVKRVA
jgi:hypothetical protein